MSQDSGDIAGCVCEEPQSKRQCLVFLIPKGLVTEDFSSNYWSDHLYVFIKSLWADYNPEWMQRDPLDIGGIAGWVVHSGSMEPGWGGGSEVGDWALISDAMARWSWCSLVNWMWVWRLMDVARCWLCFCLERLSGWWVREQWRRGSHGRQGMWLGPVPCGYSETPSRRIRPLIFHPEHNTVVQVRI